MSDTNERSIASAGSVAGEPSAWGVLRVGGSWVAILANEVQAETSRKSFDKMENWVHEAMPLYRHPQDGVVRLPRLMWDSSEKMGKGEWDYQQRVKTALEVAGVKWVEIE